MRTRGQYRIVLLASIAIVWLVLGRAQQQRVSLALTQPKKDGQLECLPDAGALYRCIVTGSATGLAANEQLLLWVRPVQPPSEAEGWYLQRRPNGIVERSGSSWRSRIQIGNRDFPPKDGDVIDVAVSVADGVVADKLSRASGVALERQPVGATVIRAENVRLRIRKQ